MKKLAPLLMSVLVFELTACSANIVSPIINNRIGSEKDQENASAQARLRQVSSLPGLTDAAPSSRPPSSPALPPVPPPKAPEQTAPNPLPQLPALPQPSQGDTGSLSVGLLWEKPFETQATRQDIASMQLSVSGPEILRLWKQPVRYQLRDPQKRLRLDQLPPGGVEVKLEAFDASGQNIGTAVVDNVLIRTGKVSRVNLELQLIDTLLEETDGGHLSIDVVVLDGKTIVRKKSLMAQGGYLRFETSAGCSESAPAPQISLPTGQLMPLSLTLPELGGSSSGLPFVLQADDLVGSSADAACDASVQPRGPEPVQLTVLSFSRSKARVALGDKLQLQTLLQARTTQGALVPSQIRWSLAEPQLAQLTNEGELIAQKLGSTQVFAETQGQRAVLQVDIVNSVSDKPTEFMRPEASMVLSASRLKRGQMLKMSVQDPKGSIHAYYWTLTGGQLAAQTYEPYSDMLMLRPGRFTAELVLIGTDGKQYPAGEQTLTVEE